ncbi:MAG: dihydroorotate dehydrogenase [Longimicrobiales bacterium]
MSDALAQRLWGATFPNPVMLAAGTAGFGRELADVTDLNALGGLVTKSVTLEPRTGNPAPRVAEYAAGMINSVGLANLGVDAFLGEALPWLAEHLREPQVLVNLAGRTVDEYAALIERIDPATGFLGYELNLSCPNVKEGGAIFCLRADLLREVVSQARASTRRPVLVKLSPNVPDIGAIVEAAVAAGADGVTLINTYPGLLFDVARRRAALGAGSGGISGPGILPMGVHAVWQARRRVDVPIIGVGGIRTADDALQYLLAGASLVQVGTASFADPRAAQRVVTGLERYLRAAAPERLADVIGSGTVCE